MRKVQVNTQVRSTKEQRDATGCGMWLPKTFEGLFHEWGVNYEEFETGPGNFTVAIVELEDGTVDTFPAHQIKSNSLIRKVNEQRNKHPRRIICDPVS